MYQFKHITIFKFIFQTTPSNLAVMLTPENVQAVLARGRAKTKRKEGEKKSRYYYSDFDPQGRKEQMCVRLSVNVSP